MDRSTLTSSAIDYVRQIADMAGEVKDDRMLIYATGQIRGMMDAVKAMRAISPAPDNQQVRQYAGGRKR